MFKRTVVLSALLLAAYSVNGQWNQWRGSADGQGNISGKAPVTEWSKTDNVIWKTKVPYRGASSPIVAGGKIFLTSTDDKRGKMYLLCYDQVSGKLLWEKLVFWGNTLKNVHKRNSNASASAATDGKVITVLFGFKQALWLSAMDLDGKKLWEAEVAKVRSNFGTGTSPLVYKDKVIVLNDMEPNNLIVAYRLSDGEVLWKTTRKDPGDGRLHSYSTPRVFTFQGKDILVTTGLGKVILYDPETGKLIWEIEAGGDVTVNTCLLNRRFLYVGGGYPQSGTTGIDIRRREVIWKNRFDSYISSMVFYKDHLYGSTNHGEFTCMDARSGTVLWRKRFREDVQASPFVAGGLIYLTLRNGVTKVIEPNHDKYIEVSENKIPGTTDATPAVVDGLLYYRGEDMLYCIGKM